MRTLSEQLRMDGWTNILTKIGLKGHDRSVSNKISRLKVLSQKTLANIYAVDGIGANIADVPPADAMRNGFKLGHDDADGERLEVIERRKVPQVVQQAHAYARAFGGALVVAQYERDTAKLDKPPSSNAVATGFRVYGRARVRVQQMDIVTDVNSKYFDDIEVYEISKRLGGSFSVHHDRCFALKGIPVPDVPDLQVEHEDLYWGMSHLQRVHDAISNFGVFTQGIGHLGQEMVIGKMKISNLEKMLLTNDIKGVETRMETIAMQKSVINMILMGKDEEFTRDALSFAGVADVLDRLMMVVAGVSRMPVTKLFGRSAAGMNATGEGDSRDYYDLLKSEQLYIKDLTEWCCLQALRTEYRGDKHPEIEFEPVWTPTQEKLLEMRERQQKIDAGYIADSVYSAATCRLNRFTNGYSFDTHIEEDEEPSAEDVDAHNKATKNAEAKMGGGE